MASDLIDGDREFLALLRKHAMLSIGQIAILQGRSKQVLRRRTQVLREAGLIQSVMSGLGHRRGRPESLLMLSAQGAAVLNEREPEGNCGADPRPPAPNARCLEHQLLINWFHIHLVHLERSLPRLAIRFFPAFHHPIQATGEVPVAGRDQGARHGGADEHAQSVPDGVFTITDSQCGKTLLFFLEADLGTETLASRKRGPGDVRQKILNYRAEFRAGGYKRYGGTNASSLNGFRVLFVTQSATRFAALCRLVAATSPSDFVWVTEERRMFAQGLTGRIWARGGHGDVELQSILGNSLACDCPIPDARS